MKYETTANLSKQSIDSLIKNLKNYQKDLEQAKTYILQALSEYTQLKAKEYLRSSVTSFSTGELENSITIEYLSNEVAKVYTNLYYAAYVEYGTGPKGSGTHPNANGINYKSESWKYYNEAIGKIVTTEGQEAHRYMYNAVRDLERDYVKIATKVLKSRGLI